MDMADLYSRASEWTAGIFDGVDPSQHGDPTPCDDWDVGTLMNHLVGGNLMFANAFGGAAAHDVHGGGEIPDFLGDDPAAAYRAAVARAAEAFSRPGAMEQMVSVPAGEFPGQVLHGIAFTEALFHGWDLATATGQDATLDPELAAAADAMVRPNVERGRELGAYGPEVAVDEQASAQERVLGLVGRRG